jgi:hypothetical protein
MVEEWIGQRPDLDPIVVSIEAKLRRTGKGKCLVIENDEDGAADQRIARPAPARLRQKGER